MWAIDPWFVIFCLGWGLVAPPIAFALGYWVKATLDKTKPK